MADFPAQLFRIDGDAGAIRGSAGKWLTFGSAAVEASGQITRIDTGNFVGPEGDLFRQGLNAEMPRHLQITGDSFNSVGGALSRFAGTLESLQDQMRPLAQRAPGLWDAMQAAQGRVDRATAADKTHDQQVANQPKDQPAQPDTYHSDSSAAGAAFSGAQREWQNCVDAANRIRGQLTTAIRDTVNVIVQAKGARFKENPKWWDLGGQFTNFVRDNKDLLKKLSGALKIVSLVAGLLSFIPVLAPIMAPLALATGLLAGAIDLSIYAATGEGNLTEILVGIGLTLLPGIGKLAGKGLSAAAPQLMSRTSSLVRNSSVYRTAMSFGSTRVGRFVTAPGRLLNRLNDGLVTQLNKTRFGQAIVNLGERGGQRAEQAFVNNRLREVDGPTQARVADYRDGLPTRTTNSQRANIQFQQRPDVAGPTEYNLQHGDDIIPLQGKDSQWADGIDTSRAGIVDGKYSQNPAYSYYNNESGLRNTIPDRWDAVRAGQVTQMENYANRLASPNNPLESMIVKVNSPQMVPYWADVMNEAGIRKGVVVVVP